MGKVKVVILVALVTISAISIGVAVRSFMIERETFEKYLEVRRALSQEEARSGKLTEMLSASEGELERLKARVDELTQQRGKLEEDREALLRSKDGLVHRVEELGQQIEEVKSEAFLAEILEERASLEVEAKNLKEKVKSQEAQLMKETRVKEELASELGKLKVEGEVAETLSRDLARAKREGFAAIETLGKIETENKELKERMAQLSETKGSLEERLLVANGQLQRAKDEIEGLAEELVKVRVALREREEEIGRVRAELTKAEEGARKAAEAKVASIELPPIVVKSDVAPAGESQTKGPQGRVVTVNDEYKFVVIDVGMDDGVEPGMPFVVYRGDREIGRVEVIEAHQRISAADITSLSDRANIKVDDVVVHSR